MESLCVKGGFRYREGLSVKRRIDEENGELVGGTVEVDMNTIENLAERVENSKSPNSFDVDIALSPKGFDPSFGIVSIEDRFFRSSHPINCGVKVLA